MPINIREFELWQPGYGGATVSIYEAGTTTLADVFTDEALTVAAANPQTLDERTIDEVVYGKFHDPLYTGSAYQLQIDSIDVTGVQRGTLSVLAGEDASDALVTPDGSSEAINLAVLFGRIVWAENEGEIGGSASTNTATITAAIGKAVALGGTHVMLPAGTIPYTALSVPAGVILKGYGRAGLATVLQSQTAGACITLSGDGAGLQDLVLDGVTLPIASIGLYGKAQDEVVIDNVLIKRYESAVLWKGGRNHSYARFFIDNCVYGMRGHGDSDAGNGGGGDQFTGLQWTSGAITGCTTAGLDLSFEDRVVENNCLRGVKISDNTGAGVLINGARFTDLHGCDFSGNVVDLTVQDDSDTSQTENIVIGLKLRNGRINGGAIQFSGNCQDVVFESQKIEDVDFVLTQPANNILLRDCTEDFSVTFSGDGTRIVRGRSVLNDPPNTAIITTNATATKAWELSLNPGEKFNLIVTVIGNAQNKNAYYARVFTRSGHLPGSTLAYDSQSSNFTLGAVLTGGTSGAIARIIADADAGAAGTLTLRDIVGEFIDNEPLTDSSGGAALANGTLVAGTVTLLGSESDISAAVTSGSAGTPAAVIAAASQQVVVNVTGAAAETWDFSVGVVALIG